MGFLDAPGMTTAAADSRYVRSVNGAAAGSDGDVTVSAAVSDADLAVAVQSGETRSALDSAYAPAALSTQAVRTINGTGPDAAGNVVVSGGVTDADLAGMVTSGSTKTTLDSTYASAGAVDTKASKSQAHSSDWVNAKEAGAKGDGSTNDGPVLQSLLNSLPEGGTLFLPTGTYITRQTLFIPPGRRLVGVTSSRWHYTYAGKCVIRAMTPWTAGHNAVIKIADETINQYGAPSDGVTVANITIDNTALPWTGNEASETVHALYCEGLVRSITLDNIAVNAARGNAFRFSAGASARTSPNVPRGIEATRLRSVNNCRKEHFYMVGTTDSIFTDCLAASGASSGFFLFNLAETKMVSCRSLFTGGHGFEITGTQDLASLQLISPSTDRNAKHGIFINSSGVRPITISSPLLSRDGSDGVSNGICIAGTASAKTSPVIIDGMVMMPGVDDNGSGTLTPLVGMALSNTTMVRATGMVWGVNSAISDGGGHRSTPTLPEFRRVGTTTSYTDSKVSSGSTELETLSRKDVTSSAISMGSTVLRATSIPDVPSEVTVSTVRVASGATAAGATPTIVRLGVYKENTDGSLSLVGSTDNDTSLLAAASTTYDKPLSSPVVLTPGVRYFVGLLVVTSATAPTVAGAVGAVASLLAASPRISAQINGRTDLPASVAVADMTNSGSLVYAKLF